MLRRVLKSFAVATLVLWAFGFSFAAELTIFWPDVEQGACMLVIGPNGTAALVDAGTHGERKPDEELVPWLMNITKDYPNFKLRYIVATNYQEEHICWIDEIIQAGLLEPDGVVYDRGETYSSDAFQRYYSSVSDRRKTIEPGDVIDLGDGARLICVIAGGKMVWGDIVEVALQNELSIGFLLAYRDFSLWVGGDLGFFGESLLIKYFSLFSDPAVDVYVVHNHGSSRSSGLLFLTRIKPEVSIVQVGDNPYGHPESQTIKSLLRVQGTNKETPFVILQNRGSYEEKLLLPYLTIPPDLYIYISDPDGDGPLPGTMKLTTDGTTYTITAHAWTIYRSTDGPPKVEMMNFQFPRKASIILEKVELIHDDGVGMDWQLSIKVNDREFVVSPYDQNKKITTFSFLGPISITLTAIAIEEDRFPDVSDKGVSEPFELQINGDWPNSYTAVLEVQVVEKKGSLIGRIGTGLTALWRFTVRIEIEWVK